MRGLGFLLLLGAGCGSTSMQRLVPPEFRRMVQTGASLDSEERGPNSAAPIERALHARGLRFGTDGSVGALYAYMRDVHRSVPAAKARPGDVVFFDVDANGLGCGNHVGLVETVEPDGRITFREWRGGFARHSYLQPADPRARRDPRGRVLNTFLRIKRPDDPEDALYFAGEMICGVYRTR